MTWDFHKQFINGQWVPSTGSGRINVVNPATTESFEWVPNGTLEDANRAVDAVSAAQPAWAATPLSERVALMKRMLENLRAMADEIVSLEVKELGSPEFSPAPRIATISLPAFRAISKLPKSLNSKANMPKVSSFASRWASSPALRRGTTH